MVLGVHHQEFFCLRLSNELARRGHTVLTASSDSAAATLTAAAAELSEIVR